MPQLDSTYFPSQFFWIIILFAIFYACVHFLIVPSLRSIFRSRSYINEKNKTTAHMLSLQTSELKLISHSKNLAMQKRIDEMKIKFDAKFKEYSKEVLDKFSHDMKLSYDNLKLEIEKQNQLLSEKSTNEYVLSLADKVVSKLTGAKL